MACEKTHQRNERAVAFPESHMLDVGHERQLAGGHQFGELSRRADRRAAAAIDVVLGTTKDQGRHFYFGRVAECVPGAPRLVMIAMLLGTRLSLPQRIG